MGLADKVKQQVVGKDESSNLTNKEATFVITKLRQATYQGTEFELFYQVMSKLQTIVENKFK